jgi:undecaprenyl-diphosphatase
VAVVQGIGGHSFPSGHTLFYVTFFGFLAYLAYAQLKPGRVRTAVLWATGLLILLVGPSRIWMGHHWASDVLASYALGLSLLVVLVQWYARRRMLVSEGAVSSVLAAG